MRLAGFRATATARSFYIHTGVWGWEGVVVDTPFDPFMVLISGSVRFDSVLICFVPLDFRPAESTPPVQSRGSVWVVRPFDHGARDRVFRPAQPCSQQQTPTCELRLWPPA